MSQILFTTHKHESVITKQLELFVFGDIHRDTESCDVDRWRDWLKYTRTFDQKNCLYLGMGDYLDFASSSEKRALMSAKLHETTIDKLDRVSMADIKALSKEMAHMKGRLIGLIGGNHGWKFANGKISDEVMAEELQTKYLGALSYIHIPISQDNSMKHGTSIDIVANHGKAGGKLAGTTINQVADLLTIFPRLDIAIMGHDHRLGSMPVVSLYAEVNGGKAGSISIKQQEHRLCRSGSFKKTYAENAESYEIGKLYRPSVLGGLHLTIFIERKTKQEGGKMSSDIITKRIVAHT